MLGVAVREPPTAASVAALSTADRQAAWLAGAARALALGTTVGFSDDVLGRFRTDVCAVNTNATTAQTAIEAADRKRMQKVAAKLRASQAAADEDKSAAVDDMADAELEAVVVASAGVVCDEGDEQSDMAAVILEGVYAASSAAAGSGVTSGTGAGCSSVSAPLLPLAVPPVPVCHRWITYTDSAGKPCTLYAIERA